MEVEFSWQLLTPYAALIGALALAFPIGWNREQHNDIVGIRTFPLVAVGAWSYAVALALINLFVLTAFARFKQHS